MSHRNHKKKQARSWRMSKQAQLVPARAKDVPFCAYFGPEGEKCPNTTDLQVVFSLKGFATLAWTACPQHREEVHQLALTFVERCQLQPHMLAFNYDETIVQVRVAVRKRIVDS